MFVRELTRNAQYNSEGFTNEKSLAKLLLTEPDKLAQTMTYIFGMEEDKFPLTFLTEGQTGGIVEVNDVQYSWDVMGRLKRTDQVVAYDYVSNPTPGIANSPFYVVFKENWLIEKHVIFAPDKTQYIVLKKPEPVTNGFKYMLQPLTTNAAAYCSLDNLKQGVSWGSGAPLTSESYGTGNRSNVMAPGKATNQISFHRWTKEIGGNLANKVSTIEFATQRGGKTKLWINEEMRQFEVTMRQDMEENFFTSEYNRNSNGQVLLKDPDSGMDLPRGAGLLEIVRNQNYDTYGTTLSINKIKNTINDIFYDDTDSKKMDVVLFCGKGFAQDFDKAIQAEGQQKLFYEAIGSEVVGKAGGNASYSGLTFGNYFTQYRHILGHTVTLKNLSFFDNGTLAELDKINGNVHPDTGFPMYSHQGLFVDFSTYNGVRNVQMYQMKGQANITGILKGLTPIPESWGGSSERNSLLIATQVDKSAYEKKMSKGININNPRRCFHLAGTL